MRADRFELRSLGMLAKIGIGCLVLTLLGGAAVSGWYLRLHHDRRDDRPGLTLDDIRAHYHGIQTKAPLLVALQARHPDGLPEAERDILVAWLRSGRISEDYDNLELGANAPAEILAARCASCHSRRATGDEAWPQLPLEFFDDIRAAASSRDVRPMSMEILAATTHTHALSLATLGLVVSALGLATGWPRRLTGALALACGAGLLADIGSWWLARWWADGALVIVGAGAVFNAAVGLLGLAVLADLLMPRREKRAENREQRSENRE